ncbi:MAG: LptA/OstA family protein [Verrucomicrobiota bacterium]
MKTHQLLLLGILAAASQAYTQTPAPKPADNTQPTTITSDQFQLDLSGRKGTFLGKVHVEGPNFQLTANEASVFLSAANKPEKFVATGDIKIQHGTRTATARQAEYDMSQQKITLTGEPIVMEKQNRVTGQTIIIYPATERMDVTGRSSVQIFP